MTTTKLRYRVRVIGTKHDYVRRYKVLDTETGRRVDGVPGGLEEWPAKYLAADLNGINLLDEDEEGERT